MQEVACRRLQRYLVHKNLHCEAGEGQPSRQRQTFLADGLHRRVTLEREERLTFPEDVR